MGIMIITLVVLIVIEALFGGLAFLAMRFIGNKTEASSYSKLFRVLSFIVVFLGLNYATFILWIANLTFQR